MQPMLTKNRFLLLLIYSQFAGTSLWFASNAIIDQLSSLTSSAALTSYVQFGFITGTLLFAFFTIADRFSARTVFFACSVLGAAFNAFILLFSDDIFLIKLIRFCTGFFLAGIYPVGMKIAADLFPKKLGKALGFLVGALVLGTSFPHLVRSLVSGLRWETVIITTSSLALSGGLLVLFFIPAMEKKGVVQKPNFALVFALFKNRAFRSAAFGYFGHMWELYAFWAILPLLFSYHNSRYNQSVDVFFWSFLVIAMGSLGCVAGGVLSQKLGSKRIAFLALLFSGFCCVAAPFFFSSLTLFFYSFVLFWGFTVTPDSPQFSTLVAQAAPLENKGTALTIVTSLGFAITVISIVILKELFSTYKEFALWLLAPGPLLGLWFVRKNMK